MCKNPKLLLEEPASQPASQAGSQSVRKRERGKGLLKVKSIANNTTTVVVGGNERRGGGAGEKVDGVAADSPKK